MTKDNVTFGQNVLAVRRKIVDAFDTNSWLELGLITGCQDLVRGHSRLLRGLSFGDPDYEASALDVLMSIVDRDPDNLQLIEGYLAGDATGGSIAVSSSSDPGPRIYIQPEAFKVPTSMPDPKLVSAMMPFSTPFDDVYQSIIAAAETVGMSASRADNVWGHSTIIQDVFDLIFRSYIVVCDFSGSNPNVFYETGIAHCLGKHVVPIAQDVEELPFDLRHHRCLIYKNNKPGREALTASLAARLGYLRSMTAPTA